MNEEAIINEIINHINYLIDELSEAIKNRDLKRVFLITKCLEVINDVILFAFDLDEEMKG